MTSASFSNLPPEIFAVICNELSRSHHKSVPAFALVSKQFHQAAVVFLFSSVKFTIVNAQFLQEDVHRYRHLLQQADTFHLVQCIVLDGRGAEDSPPTEGICWKSPVIFTEDARGKDCENVVGPWNERGAYLAEAFTQFRSLNDEVCKPLAQLMADLPRLADVVSKCPFQFPPCLLRALQKHHPQCRLHLDTFKLTSLDWTTIETYELELATSPLLYSVNATSLSQFGSGSPMDFTYDSVHRLAAGLAPNLTTLVTASEYRDDWQGYPLPHAFETKVEYRSLKHLDVKFRGAPARLSPQLKDILSNYADLRTLKLRGALDQMVLEYLATTCRFLSLEVFILQIDKPYDDPPYSETYWKSAERLILSLPRLTSLGLPGTHIALERVLQYHGPTLKALWLPREPFNITQVRQIVCTCPLLRKLGIMIKRSQGDAVEVAKYTALGTLPMLKDLTLILDRGGYWNAAKAQSTRTSEEHCDTETHDLPAKIFPPCSGRWTFQRKGLMDGGRSFTIDNKCLRDVLINYAVDENLARAIYFAISSSESGSCELKELKLHYEGAVKPRINELQAVVNEMNRSWIVERGPRDDWDCDVSIAELGREDRVRYYGRRGTAMPAEMRAIIRQLWPWGELSQNGKYDWRSWPLWPYNISEKP
ncbi:hypothetical protein N7510_005146 [Penicillium lagena]|uniref:uncharacterized protein n=1 Tax=Penicillium lagena TaxID=94218 RepID=UPI0025404790|nr:uncharacterized protein N7510_005146 [Penicillium lagena]KAJ5621162.1 hypothetical protein N7510_005146 [Penicillium lagena]